MHTFWGIARCEYRMMITRWGLWVAYGLTFAFYGFSFFGAPPGNVEAQAIAPAEIWFGAGMLIFMVNMFMPLMGGILAADRMQRDVRLGLRDLQRSTPLNDCDYILGKYVGVLLGAITPAFGTVVVLSSLSASLGMAPWGFVGSVTLAFLAMSVPAYAFVTAFSLACPLVMPLRVYQILFVGYWFWGNYLNPEFFPTLNGTLLTPNGEFAGLAFFRDSAPGAVQPTQAELATASLNVLLNWLVLVLCIMAVLMTLKLYYRWQARRA